MPDTVEADECNGVRSLVLGSYDIPKYFYTTGLEARHNRKHRSVAAKLTDLGIMIWYGSVHSHTGRNKKDQNGYRVGWARTVAQGGCRAGDGS